MKGEGERRNGACWILVLALFGLGNEELQRELKGEGERRNGACWIQVFLSVCDLVWKGSEGFYNALFE